MFSNWFSGDECGQYRTSPHKQRMDHVGSSLLDLRYANEVIRQHLHEWLRFSRHLEERGLPLLAVGGGEKGYQFSGREGATCGVTLWPPVGAEMGKLTACSLRWGFLRF